MISEKVLLESKNGSNFTIIIKNIRQLSDCNQEGIEFDLYRINKPFATGNNSIMKKMGVGNNVFEKKLRFYCDVNIDNDGLFSTKLNGFLSDVPQTTTLEELGAQAANTGQTQNSLSHDIELIRTRLTKEIMINFEKTYKDKPFVIINIDKEHDGLYKNFSTEYICQTLDEAKAEARENGLSNIEIANATPRYKGVKIEFNYLKSYKEYPEINIIIIGDEK